MKAKTFAAEVVAELNKLRGIYMQPVMDYVMIDHALDAVHRVSRRRAKRGKVKR